MFQRSEQYTGRPIQFLKLLEQDGWRFKVYSITYGPRPLEGALYDAAIRTALRALPTPAVSAHRPGLGFIICHQGRGWHYLVVSWWDNENELPQHVYVRPIEPSGASAATRQEWRRAEEGQAICVWDLQIIAPSGMRTYAMC